MGGWPHVSPKCLRVCGVVNKMLDTKNEQMVKTPGFGTGASRFFPVGSIELKTIPPELCPLPFEIPITVSGGVI